MSTTRSVSKNPKKTSVSRSDSKSSKKTSVSLKTNQSNPVKDSLQKNSPQKQSRIAIAAYYKAQARGFVPGHELEDWLSAEKEVTQ